MNVLLIAPQPFFTVRGTPIAVRQLVETLCADGHRVELLTYPFGEDVGVDGLTIHRCRRFPGVRQVGIGFSVAKLLTDLTLFARLYRMCKGSSYDVVHAVEESVYLALLLRPVHRAKVIYDMDSSLAEQLTDGHFVFRLLAPLLRRIERWAIRSADVVAPMCHDLATYAGEVRDDLVPVLHDVPLARRDIPDVAEQLNGAEGQLLALYVGNLESYQGIDLLVEAVTLLPARSPVRVVVVGGPTSEAKRLQKVAARRGLADRLEFLGPRPVSHLDDLLGQADILLSPRTKGGNTPLKLYSYMAAGRAILATRLRTHTQVLDDSTACLVEPDPVDFARGILRLADDAELRGTLGASAKNRVRREYSLSSFRKRVRSVYKRSQSQRTGASTVARTGAPGLQAPWNRRSPSDRRRSYDRRTTSRSAFDRRIGERRTLAFG